MSMIQGARKEITRLRRKLIEDERDFRAAAPPVDEFGMPDWDGAGLSLDVYERACGGAPDEELTPEELETRHRLSPYIEVFDRLERDTSVGGPP